jgi:crotonobetainyl-CoA:carnitine CoA-transferase CaiB-like acyl-CoA transferase
VTGRPPLAGIKVVDFSRLFAGPYCTMMLADLGADVVKIESPAGDDARRFGPPFLGGEGMNFMAMNRNKRDIVLDLKVLAAREIATRLASDADVIVENFRPGVTKKLGIDYEAVREKNPEVIYCSITGFGDRGAYRDRPALDMVLQAMTGIMHRQGRGVSPELLVVTLADTYAASLSVQAILAALIARARDGQGQLVEVTLFEALIAAQGYRIISDAHDIALPAWDDTVPYQAFKGSDGVWFVVAIVSRPNWIGLCTAIDRTDMTDDPRFAENHFRVENRDALIPQLEEAFATRPGDEWMEILETAGVPVGPVRRVEDLFEDPHVVERGTIYETEHPTAGRIKTMGSALHLYGTPVQVKGAAPLLGQHTDDVLRELGYDAATIAELHESGAVFGDPATSDISSPVD